jgi:alpha-tubulin suppressor-like RCC1 family protein
MNSDERLLACYRSLEVAPSASLAEVRESYRMLSRVWHPDRFGGHPGLVARATERQKEINEAYRRLVAAYQAGVAPLAGAGTTAEDAGHGSERRRTSTDPMAAESPPDRAGGGLRSRDASNATAQPLHGWRRLTARPPRQLIGAATATVAVAILIGLLFPASRPVRDAGGTPISAHMLAVGGGHACAARSDEVHCWGHNHVGQAGADPAAVVRRSVTLRMPDTVSGLAAGLTHSCAVLAGGAVRCWGGNYSAQLGNGSLDDRTAPGPLAVRQPFVELSSLSQHTCGLTADGGIFCWGSDADGQLGVGSPVAACVLEEHQFHCSDRPERIAGDSWVAVSAGGSHTCGIDDGGRVHCWGSNRHGQLGARATEGCIGPGGVQPCRRRPGPVPGARAAVALATGASHTCTLDGDGRVVCWGMNSYGQTGGADRSDSGPAVIDVGVPFRSVAAGAYHTCAVSRNDALWCWGRDGSGELRGAGRERCAGERCAPRPSRVLRRGVASVDAGFGRTCVRRTDDRIVCWGAGELTLAGSERDNVALNPALLLQRAHAAIRWRIGSVTRWIERSADRP